MRVLLIEDDSSMARSIELVLQGEGFNSYTTNLGEEGIDLAKRYDYDIILLNMGLPDMSGIEVLKTIRLAKVRTPVFIVSGENRVEMKVRALNCGADDYLTKPFHKDELIARIGAIVRRAKGYAQSIVTVGKLSVRIHQRRAFVGETSLSLTGKEYLMLEVLALNKGRTLTKEMFLDHLYDHPDEPELKIIDVFICKLRKKIAEATGGEEYIETIWGRGYALKDPEVEAVEAIAAA